MHCQSSTSIMIRLCFAVYFFFVWFAFYCELQQINGSSVTQIEHSLARARAAIRTAARTRRYISPHHESFIPRGVIYRNPYAFISTIFYFLEVCKFMTLLHSIIVDLIIISWKFSDCWVLTRSFDVLWRIRSYIEMEKRFKIWVTRKGNNHYSTLQNERYLLH